MQLYNIRPHVPEDIIRVFNPLNAKFTKWPNTLKQFIGRLPTNCLSVFGHFVGLAFKGLISDYLVGSLKANKN